MSNVEDEILTIGNRKEEMDEEESEREREEKEKQKKKELKLHFKELVDLETNMKDPKNKKILRDILFKCGVYRKKGRRAVTEFEIDQLSDFDDK